MPSSRYPNTLFHRECRWRSYRRLPAATAPNKLRSWLLDSGSLTERLTAASQGQFRLEVLRHAPGVPHLSERQALGMPPRTRAMLREVLLYGRDTPWVYARTVIPWQTLRGPLACLRKPDNRPLGAMLFAHPSMRRSPVEITYLSPHSSILPGSLTHFDEPLWGRRSVFLIDTKPLLVSEFFLPTFSPITPIGSL